MDYWLSHIRIRGGIGNKLEVIILGGSFLGLPMRYIRWFIRQIYKTIDGPLGVRANTREYIKRHHDGCETRVVGITVEARPDQVTTSLVRQLFSLGVTKIELGVPTLNEEVLAINKRGHSTREIRDSTRIIKDNGLKIGYHILFGLPGATVETDIESAKEILSNTNYLPDHLKLYFCEMFKREYMSYDIIQLFDSLRWRPYNMSQREYLLKNVIPLIPSYIRVSRIGRKFAKSDLEIEKLETPPVVQHKDFGCKCIRCREPRELLNSACTKSQTSLLEISTNDIFIEEHVSDMCLGVLRL